MEGNPHALMFAPARLAVGLEPLSVRDATHRKPRSVRTDNRFPRWSCPGATIRQTRTRAEYKHRQSQSKELPSALGVIQSGSQDRNGARASARFNIQRSKASVIREARAWSTVKRRKRAPQRPPRLDNVERGCLIIPQQPKSGFLPEAGCGGPRLLKQLRTGRTARGNAHQGHFQGRARQLTSPAFGRASLCSRRSRTSRSPKLKTLVTRSFGRAQTAWL